MRAQDLAFLDFEASSLSPSSWPIEVGVAWVDDEGHAQGWSSLIRPDRSWPLDDWAESAERVHRISARTLDDARPASEVAHELMSLIGSRRLVSDAPRLEKAWLNRLLAAAGIEPPLWFYDFDGVAATLFTGLDLDKVYEKLERIRAPHRAGPDSLRLARAIAHVLPGNGPAPG